MIIFVHHKHGSKQKKYLVAFSERIPNGHSFNILHMEGIAGELKGAGITQNEMKSGEGCSM